MYVNFSKPDDLFFYIVTNTGSIESYDIQAAKAGGVKEIQFERLIKISVAPYNQFIFIAGENRNLYKFDNGLKNQLEHYSGNHIYDEVNMLFTRDSQNLFFAA